MSEFDEALALLKSTSFDERLNGARYFGKHHSAKAIPALTAALNKEKVSYVKTALEIAISRCSAAKMPAEDLATTDDISSADIAHQLHTKAVEEVAGLLLHEIEPKIGLVRVAANEEVSDFENSKLKKHLDSLERVFHGISELRKAAATPRAEEFDLAQLVKDIITLEAEGQIENIYLQGRQPLLIVSDQNLLSLAISNGLKNAIEAIENQKEGEPKTIVIDWGTTEVDAWLSILDSGSGLNGSTEAAFKIGNTNKRGHGGFGLAIVKQAMENLDGKPILEPAHNGGARLELRWSIL